jgi:hypothetical protein
MQVSIVMEKYLNTNTEMKKENIIVDIIQEHLMKQK